jgi:hypothetical protein
MKGKEDKDIIVSVDLFKIFLMMPSTPFKWEAFESGIGNMVFFASPDSNLLPMPAHKTCHVTPIPL